MGSGAVVEALQAFTALVTATLADAHAQAIVDAEQVPVELSAQDALTALSKLAVQQQGLQGNVTKLNQGKDAC